MVGVCLELLFYCLQTNMTAVVVCFLSVLLQHGSSSIGSGAAGQVRPRGAGEEVDDSAMSAYDPYGRHKSVYKGIRLHEDTDRKALVRLQARALFRILF
jgi:hypothetical protein